MRYYNSFFFIMFLVLLGCQPGQKKSTDESGEGLNSSLAKQFTVLVENTETAEPSKDRRGNPRVSPRSINDDGTLHMVPSRDWCSGFFPGCLWYLYEQNGDEKWKDLAVTYTEKITDQQWNGGTHDMGFKMYCSFGNGLRLTGDTTYRSILIQSAKTLITRFNPNVGCLRSWDHNSDKWDFPVIIDNMMNLELLYWATKETGDSTYANIATTHALTTMKNHFRADNSTFHVIDYHPETGEVENRHTHQGYAHESAWSRGQAWGLYGYTMAYRETQNKDFLEQADKITVYMLNHPNMPADLVPYYDFDAPNIPDEPRDASAAAITASALLELAGYLPEKEQDYVDKARTIIQNLTDNYRSEAGANYGFLLGHSTGSKPADSEVDVPLIYADYYYLEALERLAKLDGANN